MVKLINILKEIVSEVRSYTDDELRDIASQFRNRKEWSNKGRASYDAAKKRGDEFMDDILPKSKTGSVARIFTDDELRDIASKFKDRKEWSQKGATSYRAAVDRGSDFINSIFPLQKGGPKVPIYKDKELEDIASKYPTKKEWKKLDRQTYDIALYKGPCYDSSTGEEVPCITRNKEKNQSLRTPNSYNSYDFINSITSHMNIDNVTGPRVVYSYTFFDKEDNIVGVYVGITTDEEARSKEHTTGISRFKSPTNSTVYNFIKENPDFTYEYKKLSDFVPLSQAQKLEGEYVEEYKKKGYPILNKRATGGAGFIQIPDSYFIKHVQDWIADKEAKGEIPYLRDYYKTKGNKLGTIYNRSKDLQKIALKGLVHKSIVLPNDEIWDIAKSFNSHGDFRINKPAVYNQARRRGLLPQIKQYFKDKTQQ